MLVHADASIMYFGLNWIDWTGPVCSPFRTTTFDPVSVFQQWILPSVDPKSITPTAISIIRIIIIIKMQTQILATLQQRQVQRQTRQRPTKSPSTVNWPARTSFTQLPQKPEVLGTTGLLSLSRKSADGPHWSKERKWTCIAPIVSISRPLSAQMWITQLPANTPHLPFLHIRIR